MGRRRRRRIVASCCVALKWRDLKHKEWQEECVEIQGWDKDGGWGWAVDRIPHCAKRKVGETCSPCLCKAAGGNIVFKCPTCVSWRSTLAWKLVCLNQWKKSAPIKKTLKPRGVEKSKLSLPAWCTKNYSVAHVEASEQSQVHLFLFPKFPLTANS